jgi:hypothetical protein
MDPWTAIARAVVYPLARAVADAWFEARAKYDRGIEEIKTPDDERRANNLRGAVERVQSVSAHGDDSRPVDSPPDRGRVGGDDLGTPT